MNVSCWKRALIEIGDPVIKYVLLNLKDQTDSNDLPSILTEMNKFLAGNFAQIADTQEGFDVATPNELSDILDNWFDKSAEIEEILENWKESGLGVATFPTDSADEFNKQIENKFDASVGSEDDPKAFERISKSLELQPYEIMYVSSSEDSLDAAQRAGLKTVRLFSKPIRDSKHRVASSLRDIGLA